MFYDLPLTAQKLYIRLQTEANPDGRIGSVRQILKAIDCTTEDVDALVEGGFLLHVDGAYFIADYWLHNKYDKSNCRHVGESPEILDGRVGFSGPACKSAYVLVDAEKADERPTKDFEKTDERPTKDL